MRLIIPFPFNYHSPYHSLPSRGCWVLSVFTFTIFISSADYFPRLHLTVCFFLTFFCALWPSWVEVTNIWSVLWNFPALMIWGNRTSLLQLRAWVSILRLASFTELEMSFLFIIDCHLCWFILSLVLCLVALVLLQTWCLVPAHYILFFWSSVICFSFSVSSLVQFPLWTKPNFRYLWVSRGLFSEIFSLVPTLNLNARWLVHDTSQFANIIMYHYWLVKATSFNVCISVFSLSTMSGFYLLPCLCA